MATEMSLRIGERIRQRREELGIKTQRELAAMIPSSAVTNQTISTWERGVNQPSAGYLADLGRALDVDVSYFLAPPHDETPDPFAAPESDRLEARVAEMETRLARLIEAQNGLLTRQSEILERVERSQAEIERLLSTQVDAARQMEAATAALRAVEPLPQRPKPAPTGSRQSAA